MDFDPEKKTFIFSLREVTRLHMHPAWQECHIDKVLALSAYLNKLKVIRLDKVEQARWPRIEARRQRVAIVLVDVLQEQLMPYVDEAIKDLESEAPDSSRDDL